MKGHVNYCVYSDNWLLVDSELNIHNINNLIYALWDLGLDPDDEISGRGELIDFSLEINVNKGNKYKCKYCNISSFSEQWDKATRCVYGDDIFTLDDSKKDNDDTYHMCPVCKNESNVDDIIEVF